MSDHHVCEACELETLGPDDHKCHNPECPSHDEHRAEVLAAPVAFDRPRPLVTIGHPTIPSDTPEDPEQGSDEVPEALVLTCSEHGELTDWRCIPERAQLRYLARTHALEVHDGDVDAKGWYW